MFNNRDLAIMGSGAILSVAFLFIPIPFIVKTFLGGAVLVVSMIVALLRLGPDKVPIESWLKRRWQYNKKVKRYTYHVAPASPPPSHNPAKTSAPDTTSVPLVRSAPSVGVHHSAPTKEAWASIPARPLAVDWAGTGVYNVVIIWLTVVGIYVVYWLQQGGADELAFLFRSFLR